MNKDDRIADLEADLIKAGNQIKELKEEVDFWKSLATELEDRQALK